MGTAPSVPDGQHACILAKIGEEFFPDHPLARSLLTAYHHVDSEKKYEKPLLLPTRPLCPADLQSTQNLLEPTS
jgi:hypothetical protein